jgi:biotin carboxyl carrier protein
VKLTAAVAGREITVDAPDYLGVLGEADRPALVDGEPVPCDVVRLRPGHYSLVFGGGRSFEVVLELPPDRTGDSAAAPEGVAAVDGASLTLKLEDTRRRALQAVAGARRAAAGAAEVVTVAAPMPGRVVAVPVEPGAAVERGQTVVVLEAMKMESAITAPHPGTVTGVLVAPGETVQQRQPLVRIEG